MTKDARTVSLGDTEKAEQLAKMLFERLSTILKEGAAVKADGPARLFFPNGIELISVVVKVGPVQLEAKVAGEKAPKLSTSEAAETGAEPATVSA